VVESNLDQQPVTVDLLQQTVPEALHVIARRLGVEVTRQGDLYYLGTLRREDRAFLVRRVRRLSAQELTQCVGVVSSDKGEVVAFTDGLVVIADRVEVLARVDELLSQVEAAESPTWVLQLYLVSLQDAALRELGFDAKPTIDVAATFASASAGAPTAASALALKGGLDAVLKTAAEDSRGGLVAQPLFLLGDGAQSTFTRGERVPVPKTTVSDQGTVTTTGYEQVQTGLVCKVSLRELTTVAAKLTLEATISDIVGFVGSAPRTREDGYQTVVPIESGGVYLVGSLVRQADGDRTLGGFRAQWSQERSDTVLQIWARAYRVGGVALQQESSDVPSVSSTTVSADR
jgi:hypothetical protein